MKVKIYRICKDNPLPTQANPGDAGWDVYAAEDVKFGPGEIKLVPLGIIAQAPKGYHFKLCIRSSVAKNRGLIQPNTLGVIDHLYSGERDEIKLMLQAPIDFGKWGYFDPERLVSKGERVGQLILEKNNDIEWDEQDSRNFTNKSRGGFGSTGH